MRRFLGWLLLVRYHEPTSNNLHYWSNMKRIITALTLVATSVAAAPLPECDLSGTMGVQNFQSNPQLVLQAEFVRKLTNASTRRSTSQTVAKGDAILVSDLEVIQKNILLKAQQPFKYSANFLAITFSYAPTTAQTALYRFKAKNGENYHVLMYSKDAVFVRDDGTLCDRVIRFSSDTSSVVAYTYQTDPEDVRFAFGKEDLSWGAAGLRIIYGGVASGAMQFQEVWARDGKILATKVHQFDQFTKDVKIAGFSIHVANTTADSAVISIDAADEVAIPLEEARAFSRHLKK